VKPIDSYKDAVMRRVAEKKAAHKTLTRRVLAVCLPLCVCLIAATTFVPPLFSANHDGATAGTPICEYPDFVNASIVSSDSTHTVTDPKQLAELYGTLQSLCQPSENNESASGSPPDLRDDDALSDITIGGLIIPESTEDLTDGADAEDNQYGTANGAVNGQRICFQTADGAQAMFILQGNRLYDALFDKTRWLTEEQLNNLTEMLVKITGAS